jgi:hypothetical protein
MGCPERGKVMFILFLEKPNRCKINRFEDIGVALDRARSEALYGDWETVSIATWYVGPTIVTFNAREMRHASQCQREARELQERPRVLPGL